MFDWGNIGVGPAEFDLAAFAQSISAEDGPAPDEFFKIYSTYRDVSTELIHASLSGIAGYLLNKLDDRTNPRLYLSRLCQLRSCLIYLSNSINLPDPQWLQYFV